jgi:hypothetical protein
MPTAAEAARFPSAWTVASTPNAEPRTSGAAASAARAAGADGEAGVRGGEQADPCGQDRAVVAESVGETPGGDRGERRGEVVRGVERQRERGRGSSVVPGGQQLCRSQDQQSSGDVADLERRDTGQQGTEPAPQTGRIRSRIGVRSRISALGAWRMA